MWFFLIFFLILAIILGGNNLVSESYFLIKLVLITFSIGLLTTLGITLKHKSKSLLDFKKKLILFFFLSLSLFIARYTFDLKFIDFYFLLLLYLALTLTFGFDFMSCIIVSLIILILLPVYFIGDFSYTAQSVAVFAFFLQSLIAGTLLLKSRFEKYDPI